MPHHRRSTLGLAVVLVVLVGPALAAQAAPDSTGAPDAGAAQNQPEKKKHGLFGKVKKVVESKSVQMVAKTAACTVVPGGQVIAAAVEAATSKDAQGAATGAAEAASGAGCANQMGNAMGGMAQAQAAAEAATQAQQAAVQTQQPQGPPLMPGMQNQLNMLSSMGIDIGTDDESEAKCLGVSVEDYRLIVYPPAMNTRPPTKAEMKARAEALKKLDPKKQQECSIKAANQAMGAVQGLMEQTQQRMAQANSGEMTEAPGQTIEVASDVASELKQGKSVIRNIDWVAGSAGLSEAGQPAFQDVVVKLGAAMKEIGGHYRLDLYLNQRYDDATVSSFAAQRLALVQNALAGVGVDMAQVVLGKSKRDKDPRLEIVRTR